MVVARGWGQGIRGELLFNRYIDSVSEDQIVLKINGCVGCKTI